MTFPENLQLILDPPKAPVVYSGQEETPESSEKQKEKSEVGKEEGKEETRRDNGRRGRSS